MTTFTATYSPEDNRLRLYASSRLDSETYARVKAAGFKWAPKQDLFVAPMWTPLREDLLLELAGEIDDEDKSLVDRAEERSERFETYSDKRMADANAARKVVDDICEHIPLGQPILVGHHSERHARRDQARIESGMRKAVQMWRTSQYWTSRAEGAIRHAKYKELPAVRHRRIKGLESDKRKQEKRLADMQVSRQKWFAEDITPEQVAAYINAGYDYDLQKELAAGTVTATEIVERYRASFIRAIAHTERWIAHYANRLTYERAMLAEQLGAETGTVDAMAARFDLKPGGRVLIGRDGWLTIIRVNKAQGAVVSVTTTAPAYVTWSRQWKYGIEQIQEYQAPTEEQAAKVKKATSLPPICNYPGEGFREMTEAEWKARRKWSDFSYFGIVKATETHGAHRMRQMPMPGSLWKKQQVYITDMKRVDPPAPAPRPELPAAEPAPRMTGYAAPQPREHASDAGFRALEGALKSGVQVVTAPQLFPTPDSVAAQVIDLAGIESTHKVLEPSAGTGKLIDQIKAAAPAEVTAIELNTRLVEALRSRYSGRGGIYIHSGDFLDFTPPESRFDRIVMNPPFERGADIRHIEHARTFLRPGGRLVAICANGPRQQEKLKPIATEWIDLPDGTFQSQGTSVRTAIVVIERE
jgi:protein-L-isoaspartate O-methyltransferase